MDYFGIALLILVISIVSAVGGIILYLWMCGKSRNEFKYHNEVEVIGCGMAVVGIILIIITVLGVGMYAMDSYERATTLPYKYITACDTVTETSQLLMRYDNISAQDLNSLGYGLESQELKLALKDAITQKNEYHQQILTFLNNPLQVYRDVLRERLPDGFT